MLFRHSVGKHSSVVRGLKSSDFDPREKFWTRFPTEGSKTTPPHTSVEFRWKDYCPVVFRYQLLTILLLFSHLRVRFMRLNPDIMLE